MMNVDDPWRSARLDFERRVLPALERVGKRIGFDAAAGEEQAKRIIHLYAMLHRSFDPLTFILLDEALAGWTKTQADAPAPAPTAP